MTNRRLEDVGDDAFRVLEKLLKPQPAVIDSNQAARKYGGVVVTTKSTPPAKMSKYDCIPKPLMRNPPAFRKLSRWGF